MALSTGLNTAVQAPFIRAFCAVQIQLSTGNINLIDGSGFLTFPVNGTATTFKSLDPVYGSLATVTAASEAVATQAPTIQVTILPPSPAGIAAISDPLEQSAPVLIWWGIINETTGVPVSSPELVFSGRIDFATITTQTTMTNVQINVISALDHLFIGDDANRLNSEWHQYVWPGETGLAGVVEASGPVWWGIATPTPLYPIIPLSPTGADQLAGTTTGGNTDGSSWGPQ